MSFMLIYVHDVACFLKITAICDVCAVILEIMICRAGSYCIQLLPSHHLPNI